jgi:hypothetical protein
MSIFPLRGMLSAVKRALCIAATLALYGTPALAQGPGAGEPRTVPPPPPAREVAPGDAAATKAPPTPETAAPADNRSREAASRCAELTGAMRSECLLEQRGSAAGASAAPEPRTGPPPQNPR